MLGATTVFFVNHDLTQKYYIYIYTCICIDILLVPYYIYKQIKYIYIYIWHLGCLIIYSYQCICQCLGSTEAGNGGLVGIRGWS